MSDRNLRRSRVVLAVLLTALLLAGACAGAAPTVQEEASSAPAASQPAGQAAQSAAPAAPAAPAVPAQEQAAAELLPLVVTPDKGPVGTAISISAEGLPPGATVDLRWATLDGGYDMQVMAETIEFYDRKFDERLVLLGRAQADGQGRLTAGFTVPEDYGETHDIVAVVDGQKVAKGGFYVDRTASVYPLDGPVGEPITIEVKGLGWTPFRNTLAVLYDHHYAGFISAVTTRGTARAVIRAAGPVGQHVIRVANASAAVPYLNKQQSPVTDPEWWFTFNVTEDRGAPAARLEFPETRELPAGLILTTSSSSVTGSLAASFAPAAGPILSQTTLRASGLPAGVEIDLLWMSAKGNRVSRSGWNLIEAPLGRATVAADGSLQSQVQIPDDLGGWHVVKLVQGEKVLGEVPYYVERSLVTVTPTRLRAGETFTVQIKGVGWTELDNTIAVTYDNSYLGYACGFNSQGDVTMHLVAYGEPGTHLIDLYPVVFKGHGAGPWNYQIPMLTALDDHPGLALGYRLPIFRLAIEVIE